MKLPTREVCLEWAEILPNSDNRNEVAYTVGEIEALIHRAYRQGVEAMREEAAKVCKSYYEGSNPHTYGLTTVEHAIRNLKVEDV